MSENLIERIKQKLQESNGEQGIYYVIKIPTRWELISHSWNTMGDKSHRHVWNDYLANYVAAAWNVKESEIKPLWRAFPRGRVEHSINLEYVVYHGNDLKPFMNVDQRRIESAFELKNQRVTWSYDSNETCSTLQQNNIRRLLNIEEVWPAPARD